MEDVPEGYFCLTIAEVQMYENDLILVPVHIQCSGNFGEI